MNGLGKLFTTICNGKNIEEILQVGRKCATINSKPVPTLTNTIIRNSSTNIRTKVLQRIQDPDLIRLKDNPNQFYTYIRDKFYENIRAGKKIIYQSRNGYNAKEFHNTLFKNENGFYGKIQESWVYRYPNNMNNNVSTVERLSLNVYQDKDLIQKLDKYLSQNCQNVFYKCPGAGNIGWNTRHDTITMYFPEKITPKIKQDIAQLAKSHIRHSNSEKMLGEKIADGVYSVLEPTKETIKPLLVKAKLMDLEPEFYQWLGHPDFYNGAGLFVMKNGQRVVHTSPGAVEALKQMLNLLGQCR